LSEAIEKWLKIENKGRIDIQIEDNSLGWLCHNTYDSEQWMFHLKDEREARLFEIIGTEGTEVERTLKNILEEYDDIVFQGVYNIENY